MEENCCLTYVPTWKDRVKWVLFKRTVPDYPDLPEGFKDGITTNQSVELSFIDRIKVLLTGRFSVRTLTFTENVIGKHQNGYTTFNVEPFRFLERSPQPMRGVE